MVLRRTPNLSVCRKLNAFSFSFSKKQTPSFHIGFSAGVQSPLLSPLLLKLARLVPWCQCHLSALSPSLVGVPYMTSAEKGKEGSRNTPNFRILWTKRGEVKNPKILLTSYMEAPCPRWPRSALSITHCLAKNV